MPTKVLPAKNPPKKVRQNLPPQKVRSKSLIFANNWPYLCRLNAKVIPAATQAACSSVGLYWNLGWWRFFQLKQVAEAMFGDAEETKESKKVRFFT